MDKDVTGSALPATTEAEAPTEGMTESMSVEQFAQFMIKQDAAKAKPAESEPEETPEATETEEKETPETEEAQSEDSEQEEESEPEQEQSDEETPPDDEEEVLSQPKTNDPDKLKKWQENVQKRINSVTAKRKEAEAKAAALEAELAALKEQPEVQTEANPIVVPISDPSDETQKALSESELAKLATDSENALNLIESNRRALLRALAKDEPTIEIGGETYQVEDVLALEQKARRHLEKLIPQRRQFLKAKTEADTQAKGMYPSLFDKKSQDYQQYETFARQFPAINQLPSARLLYGLAMDKLKDLKKPKETVKKVETPKKASADAATTTAAAPRQRGNSSGEKAQLVKQLEKAQKTYSLNGSTDNYARVLSLQSQLQKLN